WLLPEPVLGDGHGSLLDAIGQVAKVPDELLVHDPGQAGGHRLGGHESLLPHHARAVASRLGAPSPASRRSLESLYSKASASASQLASRTFSDTPTVPQTSLSSLDSMTTRTRAAVPARALITRTL